MGRADISDKLIHFTSGESYEDAYRNLCTIFSSGRLLGSRKKIKGGYSCVCFTEAPLQSLVSGLVNPSAYSKYSPFGIIVEKVWLYKLGGRPVIYQSDEEFSSLPESLRWRHVRYEPHSIPPIDFTWEREWRIQVEELEIISKTAGLVVPDRNWANQLLEDHDARQTWLIEAYSLIMDSSIVQSWREDFAWRIIPLNEPSY